MPITVLGFAGSPRRHGNSETLLDWVLEAMAAEPDVSVEKVVLVDADVHPCRGCNVCERTGACVQHDGMIPLYDRILEVDCVVLAAPIYCMGLAAQTKALVDRAQVYRSRKYVLGWPVIPEERKGKRLGLFLATAGQPWDHVFDAALPSVKCFYHVSGIRDPRYASPARQQRRRARGCRTPPHGLDQRGGARAQCRRDAPRAARVMIRVLGVSGSPHRHGNTETLLDAFLEGARGAGAEVEKVVLSTLAYAPCRGCNACHRTGVCVMKDDAGPLLERMAAADVLAVASPIYSMGVTAELKGLIDRAQYLWARRFVTNTLDYSPEHLARHRGVFLATAGSDWPGVFDAAFPVVRALFSGLGFEYAENIVYDAMDRHGGIRGRPDALEEAAAAGRRAVEGLSRA